MSELLSMNGPRVDVEPMVGRAVQWPVLNTEGCSALVARCVSIDAKYSGAWELPVLGVVTAPSAVLIRPDGYVAWVGEGTDLGLVDALTAWFGPSIAA